MSVDELKTAAGIALLCTSTVYQAADHIQTSMAAEESRSGKRRRDLDAQDEGSSAQEAAEEGLHEEAEAADGPAEAGPAAAAAAAGGALGPAAPALFAVLTRLLVLDRSIRAMRS